MNLLLFRWLLQYRVYLFSAIVVNYAVCVAIGCGLSFAPLLANTPNAPSLFDRDFYLFSAIQGALFIICFFLIGKTTELLGVAVATLATRLSVAIPTTAAFVLYSDEVTTTKLIGITATIMALYLSCRRPSNSALPVWQRLFFPSILFVVFGIHYTLLKFVQHYHLDNSSYHTYVLHAFFSAFAISAAVLVVQLIKKRAVLTRRELIGGTILGCTNYGSIYFLIKTLGESGRQSSQLFPTLNVAVVIASALCAWIIFKERLSKPLISALIIGVVAIIFINL